jgi:hypothetical protein
MKGSIRSVVDLTFLFPPIPLNPSPTLPPRPSNASMPPPLPLQASASQTLTCTPSSPSWQPSKC